MLLLIVIDVFPPEHLVLGHFLSYKSVINRSERILTNVVREVLYIVRMMEFEQLLFGCFPGPIDVEMFVYIEGLYERMGHGHPEGLHGVVLVVVELGYLLVVEVGHLLLG